MEALYIQPLVEDGVPMDEEEEEEEERGKRGEQGEGGTEASSPAGSTTEEEEEEEETDEDSEPEPPPVIRRKVSFADAFGLDLVSVKEFDNAEVTESEVKQAPEREAPCPLEEYYMSCLFTVPLSQEELDQRLQTQTLELESIELLPGTTTLRGIIRVVNLCFSKSVYVRMSLDCWTSYFDLLAEYVPGSSDRKTDRFTFRYTLVPPFDKDGTRLEMCLRYETSVGTFWANNKEMNYVLFCHQRGHANERGPQVQEESASYKSKRSCLKANRRGSADEKTWETGNTSTAVTEAEATDKAEEADRKAADSGEIQSLPYPKEHKPLVDGAKSRHRVARLARVQDHFFQRRQQVPKAHSHDSGQRVPQPLPTPWADSASFLHRRQKKQAGEGPQVLTYHQIPLLTLDWNNDKAHEWGAAHVDDIWTSGAKMTLSSAAAENIEATPPVSDMWETFRNGTDDTTAGETSVCDVWQAFLNGPSCTDHSGVPESEWLQTAASVSPSNDKEPKTRYAASSQEPDFQVGTDTPTGSRAHISAACQPLSDTRETSPANAALNAADRQPTEACVRDGSAATPDASQRSQTNSVTDTPREFSLEGATPVSEGSVDSSAECHKHAAWEPERGGIIGGAGGGGGGDGPCTAHTADLVTSSGESETTDMTAMPKSQNASAADRISQGARLDEGLSSSEEGQVTGTAHNAAGDTLAFRGTIRRGTKDAERFVFCTSRQGAEEGIAGYKASPAEEIFRPRKTEEREISPRYAGEKQREEFRLNRNSEKPLRENEGDEGGTRAARSRPGEFGADRTREDDSERSQITTNEFQSERQSLASDDEDFEEFRKTQVEPSHCTTSGETKGLIGAEGEIIQVLNEEASQRNDKALQFNSSRESGNASIISEARNKQPRPIQAGEERRFQKEDDDSTANRKQENALLKSETSGHVLVLNRTGREEHLSSDGIIDEQQEMNPSAQTGHTMESREMKKAARRDALGPRPQDKCNPKPAEVIETRWNHSRDDMKGQDEDGGREISPEDVTEKESAEERDTSTELRRRPETLERIEEDMSQRDKDERVSVGELKIEAAGELMGNVENPRGERRNAPAELKEQESSAEVESSPRVERKKSSEGTKDAITAENTVALDVMEPGLELMLVERFGEDLVRGIWEEVFDLRGQAPNRDINTVDGTAGKPTDVPDITHERLFQADFNDTFDSGVFSLTELPSDPNSSLSQGLGQTSATESGEDSREERSQPLDEEEQTRSLAGAATGLNSSARLCRDVPVSDAQSRKSLADEAQSPPESLQENCSQVRETSVRRQETGGQTEVVRKETFNLNLVWWSMFYLGQITKLLVCTLLVAGFFFCVFLYDFPAFFALYVSSSCWWFYKWKTHRVAANKASGE